MVSYEVQIESDGGFVVVLFQDGQEVDRVDCYLDEVETVAQEVALYYASCGFVREGSWLGS